MKIMTVAAAAMAVAIALTPASRASTQDAGQFPAQEKAPATFEISPPDISGFRLEFKESLVIRQDQVGWVDEKEDNDVLLLVSELFSKDGSSTKIVAGRLYPDGDAKPCALFFDDAKGVAIYALVLLNGKAVTTDGGKIRYKWAYDAVGGAVEVSMSLYSGNDPGKRSLAERKFTVALTKKEGKETDATAKGGKGDALALLSGYEKSAKLSGGGMCDGQRSAIVLFTGDAFREMMVFAPANPVKTFYLIRKDAGDEYFVKSSRSGNVEVKKLSAMDFSKELMPESMNFFRFIFFPDHPHDCSVSRHK